MLVLPLILAHFVLTEARPLLHLNTGNNIIMAHGKEHRPTYWTPFHKYMEKVKDCSNCPSVDKWEPYFAAYTEQLSRFRGRKVVMMEVGVQSGGSMMMWRSFFGAGLQYYGVDINPSAQQFASEWATIFIGDQASPAFWDSIKKKVPTVDIFLDDGGHTMNQQMTTFEVMFSHVNNHGGIYICEDLGTSYSGRHGGSPCRRKRLKHMERAAGKRSLN